MGEEQGVQAHGGLRREVQDAHDEHLGLRDVDLVEVAHTDAGADDAHDEEQREIVVGEGDVAHLRVHQAAAEEEQHGHHDEHVGHEQARHAHLHDAVNEFEPGEADRDGFDEEPEVPDEDDQETVVEDQREDPQPFGGEIGSARPHGADFRRGVAEQRTEQQHLKDHAAYDSGVAHGRVEAVRLDPVQGTLLTTRSGDGEGHGRFRPPAGDAPDDPADEDDRGQQRQRHTQQRLESGDRPRPGDGSAEQDCHE